MARVLRSHGKKAGPAEDPVVDVAEGRGTGHVKQDGLKKKTGPNPKRAIDSESNGKQDIDTKPNSKKRAIDSESPQTDPHLKKPKPNSAQNYWLIKSEPCSRVVDGRDVKFSLDDLQSLSESDWDGVRNYESKNNMCRMQYGDLCFFYHSNVPKSRPELGPGIVGVAEVVSREPIVDYTAFEKKSPYYDAKSKKEEPTWYMARVRFVRKLERVISLAEIKKLVTEEKVKELQQFALVKRARLSVVPVAKEEWDYLLGIEQKDSII